MPRIYRIKGRDLSCLVKSFPAFALLLVFILFYTLSPFLFAQQTTVTPRENPDIIIERIRLYYGLRQYQQVLLECQKLVWIDPGNKMANYYKTRAETRLKEMGIPIPTPVEFTPIPTPEISPVATTPPLATPVQTQASELPEFPTMTSPAQTPLPKTTSPFLPPSTLITETPTPEVTAAAEITPAPVLPREQPDISPEVTPEPVTDTASGPLAKFKKYQESNPALFFGILAAALVCLALIVISVILLIKKITMKKQIAKLEKMTLQAQEKMAKTIPLKKDIPAEHPESPAELPGFDFQIPDLPTPESFDNHPPPPGLPEIESPDFPQSTLPEFTEPADIPSPSTFDQIAPPQTAEPELPDIPSPTAPPMLKHPSSLEKETEFPGLPPDLPTFQEPPGAPDFSPPSDQELELPAFSFEEESLPSDAPLVEEPPKEQPLSFDLPPTEHAPSASPTDLEDLFLDSSPVNSDKEEAPGDQFEHTPSSMPPVSDQNKSPAISIEDALGFDVSPETPQNEVLVPSPENVPISQNDPGATSMDLDKFLFDVTNEDNAETILDVAGKDNQGASEESEPSFIELESDTSDKQDAFNDLIFDEKSLAETKITKPEQKPQKGFAATSDSKPDLFPLDSKEAPEMAKLELSTGFTPYGEDMEDKTAIKPVSPFTSKRMDKILPFNDSERKDHGLLPPPMQDRNETLFQEQFEKGRKAFENGDWKKAVYYLTVASAIKLNAPDLKDMLSVAREKKRSMK